MQSMIVSLAKPVEMDVRRVVLRGDRNVRRKLSRGRFCPIGLREMQGFQRAAESVDASRHRKAQGRIDDPVVSGGPPTKPSLAYQASRSRAAASRIERGLARSR